MHPTRLDPQLPLAHPRQWLTRSPRLLLLIAGAVFMWGCNRTESTPDLPPSDPTAASPTEARRPQQLPAQTSVTAEPKTLGTTPALPAPFVQVQADALQVASYENGEAAGLSSILESLGGGVGVCDFDSDGILDLLLPTGGGFPKPETISGLPSRLMRGQGDMRFADVSTHAHVDERLAYTHGVAIADYDNDGHCDALITGYGRLQLFHNMGDGTFVEQAHQRGLDDSRWSSSAAWCDMNRDGNLDLYVCHYVNWSFTNHPRCPGPDPDHPEICSPRDFDAVDHVLYLNQGDGQFVDASQAWGLAQGGKGLGVVAGDIDGDGLPEIYVANDTTENFLYHNRGDRFEEVARASGVAYDDEGIPNGSMGVDLADFNGDLLPDLWAANYERESFALYRNEGHSIFLHVSRPTGVTALAGLFVGFGTVFLDVDADGDLDVVVTNGHVIKYPQFAKRKQIPLLLENKGNKFTRRSFSSDSYFSQVHEGRGLATGDLNADGHLDLVISHVNAPPALLVSTLPAERRSLAVELIGRISNRSALGAQVILHHAQGKMLRMLNGGGSYLSTHQPLIVFELPPDCQPKSLEIVWPSGARQDMPVDAAAGKLQVIEPSAS